MTVNKSNQLVSDRAKMLKLANAIRPPYRLWDKRHDMVLKVLNPTKWPPKPKTDYEKKIWNDYCKSWDKYQDAVLKFKIYYWKLEEKYGKGYAKRVYNSLRLHRADIVGLALSEFFERR